MTTNGQRRRHLGLLVMCLLAIYGPYVLGQGIASEGYIKGDCYYFRGIIESLLEDGDFHIANNVGEDPYNGQLAQGRGGLEPDELVPKHSVFLSLLSLPWYWLLGSSGLLLFNVLQTVVVVVLVYCLCCQFSNARTSFIAALLCGTGTLFLDYSYNYSADILSTAFVLAAIGCLFSERWWWMSAIAFGLSVFAKITNVVLLVTFVPFAVYKIAQLSGPETRLKTTRKTTLTRIVLYGVLFLVSLGPFFAANYFLYGGILQTGYERTVIYGPSLDIHSNRFNQPFFAGCAQLLFDEDRMRLVDCKHSLLLTNPILFLAFLGFAFGAADRKPVDFFMPAAVGLNQFVFFAKYDMWNLCHYSNRFLMTTVALWSVYLVEFVPMVLGDADESLSEEGVEDAT